MMDFIDNILNGVTMYRLVLYYLAGLLVVAFLESFFGILPYDPAALAFSTILLLASSWAANAAFAYAFEAAPNVESVYITALILALIISPVSSSDAAGIGFLVFAGVWAMASKYIFAIGKKHIFNPAAFAVALTAVALGQSATWWVAGNYALLPFVFFGGLLVVRKIQRFDLVLSFFAVALVTTALTASAGQAFTSLTQTFLHSAIFFFAFAMLTEPLTTPPDRSRRMLYGAVTGFFFAPNMHIGSYYFSPEVALLVGNLFSYVISPKGRFMLTLTRVEEAAKDTYDFVFKSDRPFYAFRPGQYVEWTLPHPYPDERGNRRYFTLASAPTRGQVRLGVKFYPKASTWKRALSEMKEGDRLSVSHLAGDFVLPKDPKEKLAFIAGGIGITPFRSMVEYLVDRNERRDITLFYANKTSADVAYGELLARAAPLGVRTIYSLSNETAPGAVGALTPELIKQHLPDYAERTFYISGPHGMVESFTKTLRALGVSRWKIKRDFFPGFA